MKKKKSLITKSITRLILLGVVILASISVVTGLQFYSIMESEYKESGNSFIQVLSSEIDANYVKEVTAAENKEQYINLSWRSIDSYLQEDVAYDKRYLSIRVIVPDSGDSKKALCLWSESVFDDMKTQPMTEYSLSPKEQLGIVQNNSIEASKNSNELYVNIVKDKLTGTIIKPIIDNESNIIAYVELDLDLTEIQRSLILLVSAIALFIICILILALEVYFYFSKREVMEPILQLTKATSNVVDQLKNDEELKPLKIRTNDEIEDLAHSFEDMEKNLRKYIRENDKITTERERIKTELNLAANIQADMLIKYFPPFPNRKDFNIYASMNPAKEVGGDFYDFFLIDESHLALVIADVSGKGIPASLFMMRSMLMIESLTTQTRSPAQILGTLNSMISENNASKMFVTVWLAILDLKTGKLTASNAGHEYPIIKKPGEKFELYKDKHCFIVGGKKKMTYKEYEMDLEPGTVIFVYTDGVPEAKNAENKMYGLDATVDALNKEVDADVETLVKNVQGSVSDFVKDAEQFDDLTALCIEYCGPME